MIGYAPFDTEELAPRRPVATRKPSLKPTPNPVGLEETECNYVVLFFIAGVLCLAVMDAVKK